MIRLILIAFVGSIVMALVPRLAAAQAPHRALDIVGSTTLDSVEPGETAGFWRAACEVVDRAVLPGQRASLRQAMEVRTCSAGAEIGKVLEFCAEPLKHEVPKVGAYEALNKHLDKLHPGGVTPAVTSLICAESTDVVAQPASFPNPFSATWQDAVIRGTAAFVTARLRAEIELMAQERIGDALCGDARVQPLIENACKLIEQMRKGEAPLAWGTIKHAVTRDLRALPRSFGQVLSQSPDADARTLGLAIVATFQLLDGIRDGRAPVPALAALAALVDVEDPNASTRVLRVVGVVAKVMGTDLDKPVKPEEIENYVALAASLVCAELGCDAATLPQSVKDDVWRARRELEELAALVEAAAQDRDAGKKLSAERYFGVVRKAVELLGIGARLAKQLIANPDDLGPRCSASDDASPCVVIVFEELPRLVDALEAAGKGDYHDIVVALLLVSSRLGTEVPPALVKYAPFLADLASARDADSVEAALKGVAEPVGSYKKKRGGDAGFTVSMNAFAGVHGGGEFLLPRAQSEITTRTAGQLALFMPIGIDLAWGFAKRGSVSVFASIIDVGALSSFRLGDDNAAPEDPATSSDAGADVDAEPKVGFAQVMSPGLFVMLGIPQTPLAIGFGGSFSPRLRRTLVDDGAATFEQDASTIRFGAVLAADIPIVVIGRRPYRRGQRPMKKVQRITTMPQVADAADWAPTLKPTPAPAPMEPALAAANGLRKDQDFLRQLSRFDFYPSRRDARKGRYYAGEDVARIVSQWPPPNGLLEVKQMGGAAATDIATATVAISGDHQGLVAPCDATKREVRPSLVNTMLHEYMHLVPLDAAADVKLYRFEDEGVGTGWRRHAVSYQVGNLAQCYLEARAEGVVPDAISTAIDACVARKRLARNGNLRASKDVCVVAPAPAGAPPRRRRPAA